MIAFYRRHLATLYTEFIGDGWLLGQTDRFSAMGRQFRHGRENSDFTSAIILSIVLALVGVTAWLIVKYLSRKEKAGYRNPKELFLDLCRAHQLNRRERALLLQLAQDHQLAQPAAIFLSPRLFESAQEPDSEAAQREALLQIRDRLFGAPADEAAVLSN